MHLRCATFAVAATLAALPSFAYAQEKQRFSSFTDVLQAGAVLSGRGGPRNVNWIDGGARFSFINRDAQTGKETLRAYDPPTGKDSLLFSADGLTFPGTTEAFAYQSFQWAHDSKHLVFQTHFKPIFRRSGVSDYYLYSLAERKLQLAAKGAGTAELSPDGSMIGFERDGDMFVAPLATHAEKRLTTEASLHLFDGHYDWEYEEEFGMAQAWNWSPDSRHIAYWQTDDSAEPTIQLSDFAGRHPDWEQLRIPQPGDSIARVRIGVVNIASGKRVWLDTGEKGEFYIPRIYWTSRADTLAVMTLDRRQQQMKLFFFDVNTGGHRQVMSESSKTWIDVFDFYAGIQDMMTFPEGTHEFFWISDRDGQQHIYRYDYSGKLVNQVTHGAWNVTRIEGIEPKKQLVYYSSAEVSPLQRQLYEVHFDGSGPRRITKDEGTHAINMSPGAQYFIDSWSSVKQPRQVELWTAAGEKLRTLEANPQTTQWLATHAYAPVELFNFTTSDSVHIDASMVKPIPFDPARKYPVVFTIYGGPGSQAVYDRFNSNGESQWLAQQGYIVVDVNNRASNNYSSAFMKGSYEHLGKWESHDFAEAAKYMATLPYVDSKRIAIMGTSYGGYSAAYTMEMYPDIFSVGVANSAVADWRLYDNIYTERYMGLLGENEAGYKESSVVENAAKLKGHLLLIHSMMDDNVHPQNTMQLLTALTEAGKDVDLRIYPPGRHGSAFDLKSFLLIQGATDEYLARYLNGGMSTP